MSGAYTRFACGDVDTREFLYLLYLSLDDGKLLRPLYSGLRKTIPTATFLRAKIALPPKPEQQAIVRYLDYVDRRIRRYVSAKRKLIALLEEEKQAVVNQAVTGGLNPNVRLKPSGVEWLGDVPEHWEVRRLEYLATKFGSGITPRGGATVYKEYGDPVPAEPKHPLRRAPTTRCCANSTKSSLGTVWFSRKARRCPTQHHRRIHRSSMLCSQRLHGR